MGFDNWEIALELKLYSIYLRGKLGKKRIKRSIRMFKSTDSKCSEIARWYRQQSYRGVSGYGRNSI